MTNTRRITLDTLVELVDRVERGRGYALAIGESSTLKAVFHATTGSNLTVGADPATFDRVLTDRDPELATSCRHYGRHLITADALETPPVRRSAVADICGPIR